MAKTSELIVRIGATSDEFQKEMENVSKTTKNLEKQLAQVAKISGAAFAAGTATIAAATVAAGKFEDKFTNVVTLLDEASFSTKSLEDGIDGLKKGVLELGQQTGQSFDTLNTALFDLISSGVPAEEAMDTLRVTTELAAAGATDTATAVQALTATMTSFGDKAGTAAEISEKFFTAQKFGVTTVGDLATEFSKVAGTANALGISFDETLASLSSLTADGAKPTNVAATQLKATLTSIINVQKDLSKESLAVQDALDIQNVKQRGLVKSLDLLRDATGGNVSEMQRLLGSAESLSVALSLTGPQADLVKKQIAEMADEQKRAATFAEALRVKQENGNKAFQRLARVIETAAIIIGDQFAPVVSKAAELLGELFKVFNNNPVLAKSAALFLGLGTAMAGIATAGALAAGAFLKVRAAMIALNVSTRVLALGVKGLVGATGLGLLLIIASEVYNNWSVVWPAVVKIFSASVEAISKLGASLGKILKGVFTFDRKAITEGVDEAKEALSKGMDDIAKAVSSKGDTKTKIEIPVEAKVDETQVQDEVKKANDIALTEQQKNEQAKTKALTDEQKERIRANKDALAILVAQQKGASEKEIEFIRKKKALAVALEKAQAIENKEVRDSEVELIKAQKMQVENEEKVHQAKMKEIEAENKLERQELNLLLNEMSEEERARFNEQELEEMQEHILTKNEIEDMEAERKLQAQIERRNRYLQDEKRHGAFVAKLNQVLSSDQVKLAKETGNQLVQLSQSKNDSLRSIGKAAAVSQIAIDTAQGAASIFAKLNALVPILAPAIGAVGAATIVAFGAEKTANVLAANTGGIVPRGMGTPGVDSVPSILTPGELVVPEQNFDEVVSSVAAQRSGSTTTSDPDIDVEETRSIDINIEIEPKGDLMDMIEQQIITRRVQGVGIL